MMSDDLGRVRKMLAGRLLAQTEGVRRPARKLHVSYCGIMPYDGELESKGMGFQFFGDIIVERDEPRTADEVANLSEWLMDFGLPMQGRPSYGQLMLLNWHPLDG